MNQGLAGLPDWPRTRLRVEWSRSERSAVKRSEGPKVRPTCLTVVASPLWGWGPVPVGMPTMRWSRADCEKSGCSMSTGWDCRSAICEVEGGVGIEEAVADGCGEELVPVGVVGGEPAGGGVHDELLFGVGLSLQV